MSLWGPFFRRSGLSKAPGAVGVVWRAMTARLQLALDQVDLHRALRAAREGVAGGVHILEVGTPLLKAEGLGAVRAIREAFPKHEIVCDAKTMDAGRLELEAVSTVPSAEPEPPWLRALMSALEETRTPLKRTWPAS